MVNSNARAGNLAERIQYSELDMTQLIKLMTATERLNYIRFYSGESGTIPAADIQPADDVLSYDDIKQHYETGLANLNKVALIKLNGGLGTSMGLSAAKSLLTVKDKKNFLDVIVGQVEYARQKYAVNLPLIFMDSFSTDEDTLRHIKGFKNFGGLPVSFLQNKVRKINAITKKPVNYDDDPALEWCPPGHGDIYGAMYQNKVVQKLLSRGFEYIFISNVDNLGATLDLNILGYLATSGVSFIMEVANRTEADRKGGHLAKRNRDGHLILREIAQCPEKERLEGGDFQDIKKYSYFNTNSLWINLNALDKLLTKENGILTLPLIVNHKTVDPRDEHSTPVVQLETAMGAAIALFDDSVAINTPRSRFIPVKSTNDLIALRSDRYEISPENILTLTNEAAGGAGINIKLNKNFKRIDDFEKRFPYGVPSMLECTSLILEGDFIFGKNIRLIGDVKLSNTTGNQIHIPDNTVLQGTITY